MTHGARVERGAAPPRLILGHVRSDRKRAAARDEVAGVVAVVAGQCDPSAAGQMLIDHRDGRAPLRVSVGRLDLEVDQDGVAVLHQRIGRVAQFGLLARPFLASLASGSVVD